jgi:hypothetical protein
VLSVQALRGLLASGQLGAAPASMSPAQAARLLAVMSPARGAQEPLIRLSPGGSELAARPGGLFDDVEDMSLQPRTLDTAAAALVVGLAVGAEQAQEAFKPQLNELQGSIDALAASQHAGFQRSDEAFTRADEGFKTNETLHAKTHSGNSAIISQLTSVQAGLAAERRKLREQRLADAKATHEKEEEQEKAQESDNQLAASRFEALAAGQAALTGQGAQHHGEAQVLARVGLEAIEGVSEVVASASEQSTAQTATVIGVPTRVFVATTAEPAAEGGAAAPKKEKKAAAKAEQVAAAPAPTSAADDDVDPFPAVANVAALAARFEQA